MVSENKALKILFSPFGKKLLEGGTNAKTYPYAEELVAHLREEGHFVVQVGTLGEKQICDSFLANLSYKELSKMIQIYDVVIAVDSYLQHLAWFVKKQAIVLWGISDPVIFGHDCHINLLKSREYLRPNQFDSWEKVEVNKDAFVKPAQVLLALKNFQAK